MPDVRTCEGNGVYIPPDSNCDDCSAVSDQLDNVLTELDAVEAELDNKVDKVAGKGLSANDYTNADKNKLAGIEAGAQKNVTYTGFSGKPTGDQTPGFGDSFVVQQIKQNGVGQVSGTDRYVTIPSATATTSAPGLMSASDKSKLNGIASGAEANRVYNPVTGKPTGNQTPGFGDTVTISQVSQNSAGQVSVTDRTVKIPDATATTLTPGLMSAADKAKLTELENRLAAIETLIGNKTNTVMSMTDANNQEVSVTVLAE